MQDLGRRRGGYGVTNAHYGSVASALLWTFEQGMGEDFTPKVKTTWAETYIPLAGAMQDAAKKLDKAA